MALRSSIFQQGVRRLKASASGLLQGRTRLQLDAAAGPDDLDRVWQAECVEMDAILDRKDPGRSWK